MKFIVFALVLSVVVAAPPGTYWTPCSSTTTYPYTVSDLTMPNPVTNPTFNISLTGMLSTTVTAGSLKMALSFDGIPFYQETDDICKLGTPCPLAAGKVQFLLEKTFPAAPFKGTITGTVNIYDNSSSLLTCIKLSVTVIPSQNAKLQPKSEEVKSMDPPGTWWNLCSNTQKYSFQISDVTMPVPVINTTFNISFSGQLGVTITSGSIKFALSFDGIPFYQETDDICKFGVACPVSPGQRTFEITKSFPSPPFKGTITGTVSGYDAAGNVLCCVSIKVPVIPPPQKDKWAIFGLQLPKPQQP